VLSFAYRRSTKSSIDRSQADASPPSRPNRSVQMVTGSRLGCLGEYGAASAKLEMFIGDIRPWDFPVPQRTAM
jgi:hypothetical protein